MAISAEPQQRALAAAEALDAEGVRVTARAVKDRARVQMETARATAAEWNARKDSTPAAPVVPESLAIRFAAIWVEAWRAARAEFEAERQGWSARLEEADRDIDAVQEDADLTIDTLRAEIATVGNERDQAASHVETLRVELQDLRNSTADELAQVRQALADAEKVRVRIEATMEATSAERDELRRQLTAERADRDTAETRYHEQIAGLTRAQAHAQGALEATMAERDQLRADLAVARAGSLDDLA